MLYYYLKGFDWYFAFSGIFEPCRLRSAVKYPNLREHIFTTEEKIFVINLLSQESDSPRVSVKAFCAAYNIPRTTVRKWLNQFKKGEYLYSKRGRPHVIDEVGLNAIKSILSQRRDERNPPGKVETDQIIRQIDDCYHRRNVLSKDVDRRTIKKVRDEVEISQRVPQSITSARFKACSDVRMTYAQWIMVCACTKKPTTSTHLELGCQPIRLPQRWEWEISLCSQNFDQ